MNFPVIVSFDDGINVRDGQFELNAILLAGLAVTSNPAKTVYRTGERISYSGLAVTAIYTDDSTADVTSICSITPPDKTFYYGGEKLDYTGCTVTAVYWDGRTKDVTDKVTFEPPEG